LPSPSTSFFDTDHAIRDWRNDDVEKGVTNAREAARRPTEIDVRHRTDSRRQSRYFARPSFVLEGHE
jgi:heme-degrading monooxygenase HmoA